LQGLEAEAEAEVEQERAGRRETVQTCSLLPGSHLSPLPWASMRDGIGSRAGVNGKGRGRGGGDECGGGGVLRPSQEELEEDGGPTVGPPTVWGMGSQGKRWKPAYTGSHGQSDRMKLDYRTKKYARFCCF